MRRITLSVTVYADDAVTPAMVRDLLRNQLPLNPVWSSSRPAPCTGGRRR